MSKALEVGNGQSGDLQTSAIHAEAILKGEIREIPLEKLRESPWNPRQYYPEAAMAELIESMKQSGFRPWLPLLVRPLGDGDFEIGAGHRRSRAAREAGLDSVPCIVREMTDEQFLDVLNFDNCGREDVHPLHEAAGWQAWMEKTGKGVVDIAARIGQSKEYVYQRLKYDALIPEGRNIFLNGGITAGHAILIARLPAKEQEKALAYCKPRWDGQRPGVRELAGFIARDIHLDLSDAAFDLESETLLPAAGPCTTCPKRTRNAPDLVIPELEAKPSSEGGDKDLSGDEDELDETDQCTDPACFSAKLAVHLVRIREELVAKGQSPIDVSGDYSKTPKGVLSRNSYRQVPKSPDAQVAIIRNGINAGKVIHIELLKDERADRAEKQKADDAQLQKQQKKAANERGVRLKILEAIRAKTGGRLMKWEVADLIRMAIDNMGSLAGADYLCRVRGIEVPELAGNQLATDALLKALPSLSEVETFRLALELPVMKDFEGFAIRRNDPPKKLLDLARSHGVDAVKIRASIESAQKEAEGGTRREVKKKASPAPDQAKKNPKAAKKPPARTKISPKKAAAKKTASPPAKKAAPAKARKK